MNACSRAATLAVALLCTFSLTANSQSPTIDKNTKTQVAQILKDAHDTIKKHYYDPKLQGVDWDARFQQYNARLDNIRNLGDGLRTVAAFVSGLKDSHTYFIPPNRSNTYEYGYRLALIGDSCFITHVRPQTDAAAKLKVGDQVIALNGYSVNRADFHDFNYSLHTLAPQTASQLQLRSPSGEQRTVVVNTTIVKGKLVLDFTEGMDLYGEIRHAQDKDRASRSQIVEMGDLAIVKLNQFDLDLDEVRSLFGKVRKHKTLILDLRDDPGGYTDSLQFMVGSFFDHDIKIADRVGKDDHKPMIAKHESNPFTGQVIVLLNASSASSAELFARVVQLEKRGIVMGDRSAGAVMEALQYFSTQGADVQFAYGFSVTDANLIMRDGASIEKVGVTPDKVVLPTGADLAAGKDPVLAAAAEMAGVHLDPVAAGKMFPYEWVPLKK